MYDSYVMREGADMNVVLIRRIGEVVDWRKDRPWAPTDGPFKNVAKVLDL